MSATPTAKSEDMLRSLSAVGVAALIWANGCVSRHLVPLEAESGSQTWEWVQLTTRDGRVRELNDARIDGDSLVGVSFARRGGRTSRVSIPIQEIRVLEEKRLDFRRSVLYTGTAGLVVLVFGMWQFARS